MKSYKELQAEIRELQAQAEKARQAELSGAIADIKAKIREYGLTEADLFSAPARKTAGAPARPKYRDPQTGVTWCGRGKPPKWLAGQDREAFRIDKAD
jgi:DNA-binding protein H-NS